MKSLILATCVVVAAMSFGCDKAEPGGGGGGSTANTSSGGAAPAAATQQTATGEHEEHDQLPIGEKTVGDLKLVASMAAPLKSSGGGEAAFDVVITGGKPKAVRFWIGNESGEGSVKAKAEEETTDNWHAHAEVPDPLPPGSKFWVEVEPPTGETITTSFDLKTE